MEPIGFVIFLGALGYIALGRTLRREEKLITLESELELARKIQQSILPLRAPICSSFQVAARYLPMTDVAGDFYDCVVSDPERLAILVADVSGHGIPAALIASMVKLAAASQCARENNQLSLRYRSSRIACLRASFASLILACLWISIVTEPMSRGNSEEFAERGLPARNRMS